MKTTTATGRRGPAALAAVTLALAGTLLGGALLTGCGSEDSTAAAPDDWRTLDAKGVSLAVPKSFQRQSDAERSEFNAAAATRTEGGKRVGMITVQRDFTNADSAEEAAIGAEAGIQLGSTLKKTKDVEVEGTDEAKRVDFEFSSTGEKDTPPKGARVTGVIVTGLDSKDVTFAVRIDVRKDKLDSAEVKKIIESIRVG
ncbi:hypothetical protein [Streptomyces sp. H27-D2]|uniref:hypothetical protein n=1 Tax=Streptomyces sp. H27-D2 TaxID=3046304 RepID=UPI002DBEE75C|nr:hypothetical protein [Streptomyces sp. H27-D2]MEC4017121.1 hypothetical protein [Streptomyces sp. H27-D2]